MNFYILVAILPCILAYNDSHVKCPDQSACPVGKTCCETSDQYSCCDIQEHERQNKKLVPSILSHFQNNLTEPEGEVNANCSGRLCSEDWCCKYENASCCSNSTSCCPDGYNCCGTVPPNMWCCKTKQRCADTFLYCIAGANSLSSTFLSLVMVLILAVSQKHF